MTGTQGAIADRVGDRRLSIKVRALHVSMRDALNSARVEPAHLRAFAVEDVATRALHIARELRGEDHGAVHEGELAQIEDEAREAARGTRGAF